MLFAGFEYPEGVKLSDLEQWPSFAEWYERDSGSAADEANVECKEIFEAYVQGAYWEWHRRTFGVTA